jgi:hypothetical protein
MGSRLRRLSQRALRVFLALAFAFVSTATPVQAVTFKGWAVENFNTCGGSVPLPASIGGFCTETWHVDGASSEWVAANVDLTGTDPAGKSLYLDHCAGQTISPSNFTLSTTSAVVGDNAGGYQSGLVSMDCLPSTGQGRGTAFGGGGYFEVTANFTALNAPSDPDWLAPGWLWGLECTTAPVMAACPWVGAATATGISSGTYNSGTGVITLVLSGTPTTGGVGKSVTLSSLTGTGGFATLNGRWVIQSASGVNMTLQGPTGAGTSTITGGSMTPVYQHNAEFDIIEYFQNKFGGGTTNYSQTDHDWSDDVPSTNIFSQNIVTPASWTPTSNHKYGVLWIPATGSTQGEACTYFDNVLQGACVTWSQFTNNGVQLPPVSGAPWTYGIADLQHFIFRSGCSNLNKCNIIAMKVYQVNATNNLVL